MTWLCYSGAFICTVIYVATIIWDIVSHLPLGKDTKSNQTDHCLINGAGSAVGIFNVISDLYIFLLPMPYIWSLQMGTGKKIRLLITVGTGAWYVLVPLRLSNRLENHSRC